MVLKYADPSGRDELTEISIPCWDAMLGTTQQSSQYSNITIAEEFKTISTNNTTIIIPVHLSLSSIFQMPCFAAYYAYLQNIFYYHFPNAKSYYKKPVRWRPQTTEGGRVAVDFPTIHSPDGASPVVFSFGSENTHPAI
jgi:hypothetical protein